MNRMIELGNVPRFWRRRVRRYRHEWTEADRAALRENINQAVIARKGLRDSPGTRLMYRAYPGAFFDWIFETDGCGPNSNRRIKPNPITSAELKFAIALLETQRIQIQQIVASAVGQTDRVVKRQPKRKGRGGRTSSVPLQAIWDGRAKEFEAMLFSSPDELRKKLSAELRTRGYTIRIAKKVTDFVRHKSKVLRADAATKV